MQRTDIPVDDVIRATTELPSFQIPLDVLSFAGRAATP